MHAVPDHLKRHLLQGVFFVVLMPGSRRYLPTIFIHCRPRYLLEIQQKGPKLAFFSNGENSLNAISAIQKVIQNLIIILYLSIARQPIFSHCLLHSLGL